MRHATPAGASVAPSLLVQSGFESGFDSRAKEIACTSSLCKLQVRPLIIISRRSRSKQRRDHRKLPASKNRIVFVCRSEGSLRGSCLLLARSLDTQPPRRSTIIGHSMLNTLQKLATASIRTSSCSFNPPSGSQQLHRPRMLLAILSSLAEKQRLLDSRHYITVFVDGPATFFPALPRHVHQLLRRPYLKHYCEQPGQVGTRKIRG